MLIKGPPILSWFGNPLQLFLEVRLLDLLYIRAGLNGFDETKMQEKFLKFQLEHSLLLQSSKDPNNALDAFSQLSMLRMKLKKMIWGRACSKYRAKCLLCFENSEEMRQLWGFQLKTRII